MRGSFTSVVVFLWASQIIETMRLPGGSGVTGELQYFGEVARQHQLWLCCCLVAFFFLLGNTLISHCFCEVPFNTCEMFRDLRLCCSLTTDIQNKMFI